MSAGVRSEVSTLLSLLRFEVFFSFRLGEAFLLIVEWPPVFEILESDQILRTSF